jgi:ligand-binding sensor domain-containing protein
MRVFFLIFLILPISVFSQALKVGIDPELPLNNLSMDQWTGKDGLISNNLTSAQQVSSKFIWLTSFNGILRFDGNEFKLFDKKNLPFLNSNGFYQSYEDSKGNILFSSQSSGIVKYSQGNFTPLLNKKQSDLSRFFP